MEQENDISINSSDQSNLSPRPPIDEANKCACEIQLVEVNLSVTEIENEDLEEIEDDSIEDPFVSHKEIWKEINNDFDSKRLAIFIHQLSLLTDTDVDPNPAVAFLEKQVFPYLVKIIECTINKAKQEDCIKYQKSAFNGIDFIAEMLYNLNPRHLERQYTWTYVFDIDWVVAFLENHPRPFYPFSWIWSRDWAATIIQAHMRAHWVRCRPKVQEMRQFWRILKKEREENIQYPEIVCPKPCC